MNKKYTDRQEKLLTTSIYKDLQNDRKELQKYLRKFESQKSILDNLSLFLDNYISPLVNRMVDKLKGVIERGAKDGRTWYEDLSPTFNIDFSIPTKPEAVYLEALKDLHLSQKRGSITFTTVSRIRDAVTEWVRLGYTYGQIADKIQELDPFVFSRNRAEIIAINQVWKAYQYWEYLPMLDIKRNWNKVKKMWSTVHDNRVTPTHTENEGDGWVDLDHKFSWTGDLLPPATDNPRCRCALLYQVNP